MPPPRWQPAAAVEFQQINNVQSASDGGLGNREVVPMPARMPYPATRRNPHLPPLPVTPALIEALAAHLAAAGIVSPNAELRELARRLIAAQSEAGAQRVGGADAAR